MQARVRISLGATMCALVAGTLVNPTTAFGQTDEVAGDYAEDLAADGIEVLNAGVSSYSPTIYERKVRYLIEVLKREHTGSFVVVDTNQPELARFGKQVGVIKTVNMNGKAQIGAKPIVRSRIMSHLRSPFR